MENIIIHQGRKSNGLGAFGFMGLFSLSPYIDMNSPAVFYGCYTEEDITIIQGHKGLAVIIWCGLDSKRIKREWLPTLRKSNIIHVTEKEQIQPVLKDVNITSELIKPLAFLSNNTPQPPGEKVYTYIHKKNAAYYGAEIIKQLNTPFEILVADYTIEQKEWYAGKCEEYYEQAFIGLALSTYCAGGTSILEMGLRGIRVVTNVLTTPNTIPWKTLADIESAILQESTKIGTVDTELIDIMKEACVHEIKNGFYLKTLLK